MGKGRTAPHQDAITDEMWATVNPFNRQMVEEFLQNSTHLSPDSIKTYTSSLRIFFYWVKEHLGDKKCTEIKSRDFMFYQNSLIRRGLSERSLKIKRSPVSAFNQYIMLYYEDEYPTFRNYVTKNIQVPKTGDVHKKEPLNPEEYQLLCDELEKRGDWQKLAYVKFSYSTGCRRAEAVQLLKEVINYKPKKKMIKIKDENGKESEMEVISYKTHDIRCKGHGTVGNVRQLQFGQDAMDAIIKWLEVRGEDDCPYVFVRKTKNGKCNQLNETTFNNWCTNIFEKIIGRRMHPHLFRESRATNIVVYEQKSIEVARKLLGHESSETTKIYVINNEESDADDAFI